MLNGSNMAKLAISNCAHLIMFKYFNIEVSKCFIFKLATARLAFLLELLEFSEDRSPWESVEEKLNAIRWE